jgi:hypothetical protein
VAGPGVAIEDAEVCHPLRPERVQVEVAHEFQEGGVCLHDDRRVPVLEKVARAAVAAVEAPGVAGEERAHAAREGPVPCPEEVGMIWEECPGVDGQGAGLHQEGESREEVDAIEVIPEDDRPLDAPHHHMVQGARGIQPRPTGHGTTYANTLSLRCATAAGRWRTPRR